MPSKERTKRTRALKATLQANFHYTALIMHEKEGRPFEPLTCEVTLGRFAERSREAAMKMIWRETRGLSDVA
jgi:hypothetical protein